LKRKSKQNEKIFAPTQCYETPVYITRLDTLSDKQRQAGLFFYKPAKKSCGQLKQPTTALFI